MKTAFNRWILFTLLLLLSFSLANATPPRPATLLRIRGGIISPPPYAYTNSVALHNAGVDAPNAINATGLISSTTFNSLVVLVDFPDVPVSVDPSFFDHLVFDHAPGTVANYMDEVSYGEFELTTSHLPSALGWFRAPHNLAYYVNSQNGFGSPHNSKDLVLDLLALLDPIVDFSLYDHDEDGTADGLIIVHAGADAIYTGSNDDIWSHTWALDTPYTTLSGIEVSTYSVVAEYFDVPYDLTAGVICHQIGHGVLGLPDLYDYDYTSAGLGFWSLMSYGMWNGPTRMGESPAHPDAWSRTRATFGAPCNATYDSISVTLPPIESIGRYYRIWTEGEVGTDYFLIENRQQTGYDQYLLGSGLLVYHVDETVTTWNLHEWIPSSPPDPDHYCVALEQADGDRDLENARNLGDADDPFPHGGAIDFNRTTNPSSRDYSFGNTSVAIDTIVQAGNDITMDLMVGRPRNPSVHIELIPVSQPWYIPVIGGNIEYQINITSSTGIPNINCDLWYEMILPDYSRTLISQMPTMITPGMNMTSPVLNATVPAPAPPGPYLFVVRLGYYPSVVGDEDMFPYVKQMFGSAILAPSGTSDLVGGSRPGFLTTGEENDREILPTEFRVGEPWPNPFNAQTSIDIALPGQAKLHAFVFNTIGQQVATLADGTYHAGEHRLTLTASDLPSGVYFLTVSANSTNFTRKLVLLK